MTRLMMALVVLVVGIALPVRAQEGKEPIGKLIDKHFEKGEVKYDYVLYLPPSYHKDEKAALPLVLFLHGKGDKLARMKANGLPKQVERKEAIPFILVAPENPDQFWKPASLSALLDDVEGKYRVDKDRIYVTGLSMGGFGTWALAAAYPDRFAAIIPICGGGNPRTAAKLKDLPIQVFHGGKDNIVPAARSEAMVKALKDAGSDNVKLTLYPDAGHDSWTATYRNPEVWAWLLAQRRGAAKKE